MIYRLNEVKVSMTGFIDAPLMALAVLRQAIVTSWIRPGTKLDEVQIAKELNLSRMPVRQAINVLQSEGLVTKSYRKVPFVTVLTQSEVLQNYNIRAVLEPLAVEKAIEVVKPEEIENIKEALMDVEKAATIFDFLESNRRFHISLYKPSGWNMLIELIERLRNSVDRYAALRESLFPELYNSSKKGHAEIFDAYIARDVHRCKKLLFEHAMSAMTYIAEVVKEFESLLPG
jgi:DNA-binding GntR family transcriptional regulator